MSNYLKKLNVNISLYELELNFLNSGLVDYAKLGSIKVTSELIEYIKNIIGPDDWKKLKEVMQQLVRAIQLGKINFTEFTYVHDSLGGVIGILKSFYQGDKSGTFPNIKYTRNEIQESNYSFLGILIYVLHDKGSLWYLKNMDLVEENISSAIQSLKKISNWSGNVEILKAT